MLPASKKGTLARDREADAGRASRRSSFTGAAGPLPEDGGGSVIDDDALLEQQVQYYRARAPEYDDWFERRGRYDPGAEHTTRWNAEVGAVRNALHSSPLRGSVLELACGTGWWTAELARPDVSIPDVSIKAVDSSAEPRCIVKQGTRRN